jgi:hypothetical protein
VGWTNHKPTKGIIGPFLRWWDWWGRTQRARQFSLWSRSQGPMLHCAREIILTRLIVMRRPSLLLIQHENTNSAWSLIMDNYRKIIKEYMHPIGSYMWLALISWYSQEFKYNNVNYNIYQICLEIIIAIYNSKHTSLDFIYKLTIILVTWNCKPIQQVTLFKRSHWWAYLGCQGINWCISTPLLGSLFFAFILVHLWLPFLWGCHSITFLDPL